MTLKLSAALGFSYTRKRLKFIKFNMKKTPQNNNFLLFFIFIFIMFLILCFNNNYLHYNKNNKDYYNIFTLFCAQLP